MIKLYTGIVIYVYLSCQSIKGVTEFYDEYLKESTNYSSVYNKIEAKPECKKFECKVKETL